MDNEQRQLAVLGVTAQFLNDGPIPRAGIFQVPGQSNRFSMLMTQFNILNISQPVRFETRSFDRYIVQPGLSPYCWKATTKSAALPPD